MQIVCLDLEGVLVPEIWIEFARRTGIAELRRTTRDEPDYDKLMRGRLAILDQHGSREQGTIFLLEEALQHGILETLDVDLHHVDTCDLLAAQQVAERKHGDGKVRAVDAGSAISAANDQAAHGVVDQVSTAFTTAIAKLDETTTDPEIGRATRTATARLLDAIKAELTGGGTDDDPPADPAPPTPIEPGPSA